MEAKPKSRSLLSKILIGAAVLVCLCLGLSALSGNLSKGTPATQPTTQSSNIVVTTYSTQPAAAQAAVTEGPTNTPEPSPTAVPQPTDTPLPAGSAKDNPAPIGTSVNAKEFSVVVNRVVRPADQAVAAGNMFNQKAEKGQEYVQVFVTVACNADAKTKCNVSASNFKMSGTKGIVYDPQIFMAGVDGTLESTEFYGGAKLEDKSIFFLVGQGETNVVLEFQAGLLFQESAFFAIPDQAQ